MNLAIIPARGGSKRIPKKNIKLFKGKPIINYSIDAAVKSGIFDKVIVSTDSEEIASVAKKAGAEVPFMRPAELSGDSSLLEDVICHAINWFKKRGFRVKYVCCILPTAPFIGEKHMKDGYRLIKRKKLSSVFAAATFSYPILRALKVTGGGRTKMFWPEYENVMSNKLPQAYHDAGQFYWLDAERFLRSKKFFGSDAMFIILPRYMVQDIDTNEDWDMAELMYEVLKRRRDR